MLHQCILNDSPEAAGAGQNSAIGTLVPRLGLVLDRQLQLEGAVLEQHQAAHGGEEGGLGVLLHGAQRVVEADGVDVGAGDLHDAVDLEPVPGARRLLPQTIMAPSLHSLPVAAKGECGDRLVVAPHRQPGGGGQGEEAGRVLLDLRRVVQFEEVEEAGEGDGDEVGPASASSTCCPA